MVKLVSVWWDGQWAQAPHNPMVLGHPPALSLLLPHCVPETICGASLVEPPGWMAPEETFYWCPHLSSGVTDPAWPPLPQIGPCCPALLPTERLLWHWWATGDSDLSWRGAGLKKGRLGQAPSMQTKVGCLPGMILPSSPCLWPGRGVKFSGNQTILMTVSPTLAWSLPKPPG